jgi:putative transmembrane protein PGPGW
MKSFKRILIMILGGTVLAIGIAMVVLPGPAFIIIPAGLSILAIEFAWARRWLNSTRALLPQRLRDQLLSQKLTIISAWRRLELPFRQGRQSLHPKRKVT